MSHAAVNSPAPYRPRVGGLAGACGRIAAISLAAILTTAALTPLPAQRSREIVQGDRIRVLATQPGTAFSRPTIGTFAGATADTLYLRRRDSLMAFHRLSVAGVEVSAGRGSYWKTGAIAGGLLGAATGVIGVIAYCGQEDCSTAPQAALMFGTAFGAAAAGLGAMVGLAVPRRERWIPADVRLTLSGRR